MDLTRQTAIPDHGWSQRYDVVQELGDCYATVGDLPQAQQCYERAATLAPDEAGPYLGTAVVALQQGKLDDAEIAFRVALRLDGGSSKAFAGLAMIAQQRRQWPKAFDMYLRSLDLDGDNLTALLGLFQASCQMGTFSQVIEYLRTYLKIHPSDTAVMFCLAALYMRENSPDKAQHLLRDVLALEPNNTDARNLLEEAENRLSGMK